MGRVQVGMAWRAVLPSLSHQNKHYATELFCFNFNQTLPTFTPSQNKLHQPHHITSHRITSLTTDLYLHGSTAIIRMRTLRFLALTLPDPTSALCRSRE
ncbi:hypothetical protein VTL71DRAFT_7974 [Oculimacula yallundae]|uniref:Uncharacterized protein n=1 Tax=Oculimacula yallundae TaxID=86028 RepID=A0ABR4CXJ1_9HELO